MASASQGGHSISIPDPDCTDKGNRIEWLFLFNAGGNAPANAGTLQDFATVAVSDND